jgi:hypothetical protein
LLIVICILLLLVVRNLLSAVGFLLSIVGSSRCLLSAFVGADSHVSVVERQQLIVDRAFIHCCWLLIVLCRLLGISC